MLLIAGEPVAAAGQRFRHLEKEGEEEEEEEKGENSYYSTQKSKFKHL